MYIFFLNRVAPSTIGYEINDPWDIVDLFEDKIAEYAGSKFAIALDSCTNAMFLCLKYLKAKGEIKIPKKTYLSVPSLIIHSGCKPIFGEIEWSGVYQLNPYPIVDGQHDLEKICILKIRIIVFLFIEKILQ